MTLLYWYVLVILPLILIGGAYGALWLTRGDAEGDGPGRR